MSRKTVIFAKKVAQATRKGRGRAEAIALLTPHQEVKGNGLSKRGGKVGRAGGSVTKPRIKPAPKV